MKTNNYKIDNSIEKLNKRKSTLFLDQKEQIEIKNKLKKESYEIYSLFKDCDKVIFYKETPPNIKLFKIENSKDLRHQDILGTILSLGIDSSYIGDIIKIEDFFYIFVLEEISSYLKQNLTKIKKENVFLKEEKLSIFENFERVFEEIVIHVSSNRLDVLLASLLNLSRSKVEEKIKNKEVLINYETATKTSYFLRENDIFSVRKYGKYKYQGIVRETKKKKYIVKILKYT